MTNSITIDIKPDICEGDVCYNGGRSCLSIKIVKESKDLSVLEERILKMPLEQDKFLLSVENNNNSLIKYIDSDKIILSFPNEFVKSKEFYTLSVTPKGEIRLFVAGFDSKDSKLLIADKNITTDKLILKSNALIEVAGESYLGEIEIESDAFVNHGILDSKKCTIKCQRDVNNFGRISAVERLEFNLNNGVLFNESIIYCGNSSDTDKRSPCQFIYEGHGIQVGPNGVIYSLDKMKFMNFGDLDVAGQILSGFELSYWGGRHIHVHKDGCILSKNRAYINCEGFGDVKGKVGARVDFSFRPKRGLTNANTGCIGSKGFMTIDTKGKLENFNSIETGKFFYGSAQEISNFGKILSKKHAQVHGYAKFHNEGDLLSKEHGIFDAHGSDFVNTAGARTLAGENEVRGRNVYNLATHYLREVEFLRFIEHTSAEQDVVKYAKFCLNLMIEKDQSELTDNQQQYIQSLIILLNQAGVKPKASVLFARKLNNTIIPAFNSYARQAIINGCFECDPKQNVVQTVSGVAGTFERAISEIAHKPGGLIAGLKSLSITTENFDNDGLIVSGSDLTLENIQHINNLISGYIIAFGTTSIHAQATLLNAGIIISKIKTDITASEWLVNLASGLICGSDIIAKAKQMENSGEVLGGNLTIKMKNIFKQHAGGKITGVEALHLLSGTVVNEGIICSFRNLDLEVTNILDNAKSGLITAKDAAMLVCMGIIKNVGEIKSCHDIVIKAKEVMLDLISSRVVGKDQIKILAECAIRNAGLLSGKNIEVSTSSFNSTIEFFASSDVCGGDISVSSYNLHHAGNIKAGHDFVAKIKGHWARQSSGRFEAANIAKLYLDNGYTFDQELHAKNHLEIHGGPNSQFKFAKDVTSCGDLTVTGSKVINGVSNGAFVKLQAGGQFKAVCDDFDNQHGGIFGQTDVSIEAKDQIVNGREVASNTDSITVNSSFIQNRRTRSFFRRNTQVACSSPTLQEEYTKTISNGSYIVSGGTATFKSGSGGLVNDHAEIHVAKDCKIDMASGALKTQQAR